MRSFSVGGRVKRWYLNTGYIHPMLLSGKGIVTNLQITWYHLSVCHGRRGNTLNKIRSSEYWILNTNSVIRSFIARCVKCWYLRGKVGERKMDMKPVKSCYTSWSSTEHENRLIHSSTKKVYSTSRKHKTDKMWQRY